MDKLERAERLARLNLGRINHQIGELIKGRTCVDKNAFLQIESLFDLTLMPEFEKHQSVVNDLLELIDSSSSADQKKKEKKTEEVLILADEARSIVSSVQASIRSFRSQLVEPRKSIATPSSNNSSSHLLKMKDIEVPKFNGELGQFYHFKNLFHNLVHINPDLKDPQRLYFLQQALIGDAEQTLRDFDLNSANAYQEAWSYFLNRYENKRAIIESHFRNLINVEPIKNDKGIRSLLDKVNLIIRGLKVCGETIDPTFSKFIAYFVGTKLDKNTSKDWRNSILSTETYPNYEEMEKFLKIRSLAAEVSGEDRIETTINNKKVDKKSFVATSKGSCYLCHQNHFLNQCSEFRAKKPQARFEIVKKKRLCLVCLSPDHGANDCSKLQFRCKCGKNHHSLLHFEFRNESEKTDDSISSNVIPKTVESSGSEKSEIKSNFSGACVRKNDRTVMLPSAIVKFKCGSIYGTARILLDSCSQLVLMSDTFVRKYKLSTTPERGSVRGVGGRTSIKGIIGLTIFSKHSDFELDINAEVVPASSVDYQVDVNFPDDVVSYFRRFPLADPIFRNKTAVIHEVDMIIGSEFYERCMLNDTRSINNLYLRSTQFGWIVSGAVPATYNRPEFSGLTLDELDYTLRKFWEIEECESQVNNKSAEAEACVKHFDSTYSLANNGQFVVRLPFKIDRSQVSDNRELALASLYRLEKRLDKKSWIAYSQFMEEYEKMGHMSLAEPTNEAKYYIPHREVIREESSTTPLRVVFNASSCRKGNLSLNSALMVGPSIQSELFDILVTMRSYKYILCADIAKMYRMIIVHPDDRDMQRILWRRDASEPVREYRLNTVTYGTASASFIATKCLEKIAEEVAVLHHPVAQLILKNFYMDDLIAGADTEEALCEAQRIIHDALFRHGFVLRKYTTNSDSLRKIIPLELQTNLKSVEFSSDVCVAVLGISWLPLSDTYNIQIKLHSKQFEGKTKVSKRMVASHIARVFDPLGFVSPITIRGKLILQLIWREGKDWDEAVSDPVKEMFLQYISDLEKLGSFAVPRCVYTPETVRQIVAFCDASEKAYAVVLYFRAVHSDGRVSCSMICSKTKVAPVRPLTVPKLELKAAEMLTELVPRVATNLNVDMKNVFAFSDSTVVLCWLSKPSADWKKFVSNKIAKIVNVLPFRQWHYVSTHQNPADLPTRGLMVDNFLSKEEGRWLFAPDFLQQANAFNYFVIPNMDVNNALEKRKKKAIVLSVTQSDKHFFENFSSLPRLVRVVAYMLRLKKVNRPQTKSVGTEEFRAAFNVVIRVTQNLYISKANLTSLTPFTDSSGILRVGGRVQQALLSTDRKHPVLIPAKSHFARLLCKHLHTTYFHAQRSLLTTLLVGRYWIVGGRTNLIKFTIHSCVDCTRMKGKVIEQIMGNLPVSRFAINRPFTHTGVDLAGPFVCKCVGHRTTTNFKIYLAVLVCLSTRAVHLEIVSDLTMPKFMEAFHRFMARRGKPAKVYSDSGSNFRATRNFFLLHEEELMQFAAAQDWELIPPRAPSFGGAWEAAVKSAKKHLLAVTKGNSMTFEEYSTLFARIEAILNSRPLCYSKHLSQDAEIVTPAHFLVGSSLLASPMDIESEKISLPRRLQLLHTQIQSFWRVWSKDYVNQLQLRRKWKTPHPNLQEGSIVFVKGDEYSQPFDWPLGRVVKVYPGPDGRVRVADVQFRGSVKRRAISKLVDLFAPEPTAQLGEDVQ